MELTRDELIELIGFALWRSIDLRPRKRSVDDARLWAARLVAQPELSSGVFTRPPSPSPQRTR